MKVDYLVNVLHRRTRRARYETIYENRSVKMTPTESNAPASCGVSMSGGSSRNFGEFKFEATVWCTVPAASTSQKDIAAAHALAASHVRRELAVRMQEAADVVDAVLSEMEAKAEAANA